MSHFDILLAKQLSGGGSGGLTPYATTREFTVLTIAQITLTDEEYGLFKNSGTDLIVARVRTTSDKYVYFSTSGSPTDKTFAIQFATKRRADVFEESHAYTMEITDETKKMAHRNADIGLTFSVIYEFYSLESIL